MLKLIEKVILMIPFLLKYIAEMIKQDGVVSNNKGSSYEG